MGILFSLLRLSKVPTKTSCPEPKVILITGASAGIGKHLALTMLRRGHIVYGAARRVDKMKDIAQLGGSAIKLDVTKPEENRAVVERVVKEQGKIDVLVNNAGMGFAASVEDSPLQKTRYLFDVDFFAVIDLTQQVLPHMRKARSGLIVNMSSCSGKIYSIFSSSYTAAKHALEGWSDTLRIEASLFDIQVAIIQPGYIQTDIFDTSPHLTPENSPYKGLADAYVENMVGECRQKAHPPSVVADALIHAVESGHPKQRYVMGYMAAYAMFLRQWLGDRVYDFIMKGLVAKLLEQVDTQKDNSNDKLKQS